MSVDQRDGSSGPELAPSSPETGRLDKHARGKSGPEEEPLIHARSTTLDDTSLGAKAERMPLNVNTETPRSHANQAMSKPNPALTYLDRGRSTSLTSSMSLNPSRASTPGRPSVERLVKFTPQASHHSFVDVDGSIRQLRQQTWVPASRLQSSGSFLVCPRASSCPMVLVAPHSPANPPGNVWWGSSFAAPLSPVKTGHSWWRPSYEMMPKSPHLHALDPECSSRESGDTDDAVCSATVVVKRKHAYLACVCIAVAVVILALLFTANIFSTAKSAAAQPLHSTATDAAAAALMGGSPAGSMAGAANTTRARRAQRLTEKYIKLRFENDVKALESVFAVDIELHVDLSRAGMLVAMKIKTSLGFHTELIGRDKVASYYRALPTESEDPLPKSNSFRCFNDACIVTCTVHRPLVGSVTDVGTLHWGSKQDKLQRVDLSFWSK